MREDPRLKIRIVHSSDPASVSGPALIEFEIGRNGDTHSKDEAFSSVINRGGGLPGTVVLYKYCYADIDSSTNVESVFQGYRRNVSALKARYPWLAIVHVTVPLTVAEGDVKSWIKRRLGRATVRDLDVKRNQFNGLLAQEYRGTDPIFDLAGAESTRADGSRCLFWQGQDKIYALAPEFSSDGGHLNEAGRRAVAERLLETLARISARQSQQTDRMTTHLSMNRG